MDRFTYFNRLDGLLKMIERGAISTPEQAAGFFNCSEKTIRNMINYLRSEGKDIIYCRRTNCYKLVE